MKRLKLFLNTSIYIGIIFTYNGNFNKAKKYLFDQATRAMYALISKSRKLNLPIDIQLHLFDSLVVPILLYGCEIWGFENNSIIEKLHLKFCKTILHVKKSTPSCMVYGELGRFPLDIRIKCRLITFWSRLVSSDLCRTSCILYNLMYSLYVKDSFHSNWLKFVKNILDNNGFSFVWIFQKVNSNTGFKHTLLQRLNDQFRQNWSSDINTS